MNNKSTSKQPAMAMPMMAPQAAPFAHTAKEDEKKPTQVIHININQDAAVPGMAVQKTPEPDRGSTRSMLQKNVDNYKAGQKLIVPTASGPMHFKRCGSKIVDDEPKKAKRRCQSGQQAGHLSDAQIAQGAY